MLFACKTIDDTAYLAQGGTAVAVGIPWGCDPGILGFLERRDPAAFIPLFDGTGPANGGTSERAIYPNGYSGLAFPRRNAHLVMQWFEAREDMRCGQDEGGLTPIQMPSSAQTLVQILTNALNYLDQGLPMDP